jgi:histidinol-phosphate aminotransferase
MIKARKAVVEMDEYNPPTSGRESYLRLDFNENTVGCSPKVIETLKKIKQESLSVYPEYIDFRKKLAKFLKVKFDQVIPTNATDEAIKTVIETYIEKGKDEIIIPVPTFAMFKFYAQLNEAIIKEVLYNDDLSFPTERVLKEINPKTKIVVLVNPNNPTGTSIKKEDIVRIIKKAKENDALVFIDEAYYPFFNESSIGLIDKFDNLIVSQTFSKAFGVANLRLGYLVSNQENIKNLLKVISPYSVNGIAVKCAFAALDDYDYAKSYVKEINQNKIRLYNELRKLSIGYFESDANFVLINAGEKCKEYYEKLKQRGILVRDRSNDPLLKGYLRITIGANEQMEKLVKALKEIK